MVCVVLGAGGAVSVQVWTSLDALNRGTASYTYVDTNQAILLYADPTQGDAESTTTVNVGLGRLGRTIGAASNLAVSVSGINGLTIAVASILGSTLEATNLVLRIPPSPTVITTATRIAISIRPTGTGALKTVAFTFDFLPPGAARVTFFSPSQYYLDGAISMSIEAANFPSSAPRLSSDAVRIIFIPGLLNVTADSLVYTSAAEPRTSVIITCRIPPGIAAGAVTPRLYAPSVFVDVAFASAFTYTEAPAVELKGVFPIRYIGPAMNVCHIRRWLTHKSV